MATIDTQTVTVGTATTGSGYTTSTYFGFGQSGPVHGSISDGTCNFLSGDTYRAIRWSSLATIVEISVNSTAGTGADNSFNSVTINGTTINESSLTFSSSASVVTWTGSLASNPFPASGNVTVTFDGTAADNTPENYTNLAADKTGAALSTYYYATFANTTPGTSSPGTGFNVGTTVDNGTAISVASGQYRINSGSFTSTAGTVQQNDVVYYRRLSSGSNSTLVQGSLTIGDTTRTFDITTVGATTYAISAPASINEGSSGTVNVTTTNFGSGTLYWDVDLASDYATSSGTVSISSNAGSFTLTPTADSATEGAETDTVRLYTDSGRTNEVANDSFTINDTSTGGGGSSGGGGDGTGTYGLIVFGPDGSTELFSSRVRQTNILVAANNVSIASGATQSYTGITDATDSNKIAVGVTDYSASYFYYDDSFTVSRSTANGGTISITNDSNTTLTPDILIFRIA